ncbi:hypothetical protein Btru_041444 [Bulinus truncatus]|nr:hypothetical protein Btru_041444 [Bulinus truncatus]
MPSNVKHVRDTHANLQSHDRPVIVNISKITRKMSARTARHRRSYVYAMSASEDGTLGTQKTAGHLKVFEIRGEENSMNKTAMTDPDKMDTFSSECPAKCHCDSLECDCQSLDLSCVPTNLNAGITKLDLSYNAIKELPSNAFALYKKLKHLRLYKNSLYKLDTFSFCELTDLQSLDLSNNLLSMIKGTFPKGVFKDLTSLIELKINKNNNTLQAGVDFEYPDEALADLTSLSTLYMDGLTNKSLGQNFTELKHLTNLQMTGFVDGYCNLHSVNNETFQHVPWLTVLNISNCHLYHIHPSTFEHLKNLTSLDIHYNENLGIDNFPQITQSLKNSRLKFLDASTIESRYSTGKSVNSSHIRNLPSTLEILKVAGNSIEIVQTDIFHLLPPNLTLLDVGKNKFEFGEYLLHLTELQQLKHLRICGEDFLYDIPTAFPFSAVSGDSRKRKIGKRSLRREINFTFPIPPKLEVLDMYNAGLNYKLTSLNLNSNNSLFALNLDRNYLPELDGPFIGFDYLRSFSIANSFVSFIDYRFFSNLRSLEKLDLRGNLLGDFFQENRKQIYTNLTNLSFLDMSFNAISTLHVGIFKGLFNLTVLNLSRNKLFDFNVSIDDLHNLSLLNLSFNNIRRLPPHVMDHINNIRASRSIQVDLSVNPIECTCENLEFLQWMIHSKCFETFDNYFCSQEDGSLLNLTDGYSDTVDLLSRKCASNVALFIIIIGATFVLVCVLLVMMLYRFRWKLRYLYYAAYLSYQQKINRHIPTQFEYDVFISYEHKDEMFVVQTVCPELEKRGVKFYVHGLNFVAGNYIISNIVHAVKVCRKTLVILTKEMVQSYWCKCEVQMANMEAVSTGRPVLVFLFKDKIPDNKLGELLGFIKSSTYIAFPQEDTSNERNMKMFFDKLASDLK